MQKTFKKQFSSICSYTNMEELSFFFVVANLANTRVRISDHFFICYSRSVINGIIIYTNKLGNRFLLNASFIYLFYLFRIHFLSEMKKILEALLFLKALIECTHAFSSSDSSGYADLRNNDYEKYSSELNRNFKVPTLDSLFQKVSFRDNGNISSMCPHGHGIKRDTMCQKIVTFDREGYEKSLQDTRRLILSRLHLDHEPKIEINKSTLNFIEQIERNLLDDDPDSDVQYSTRKTKYDMKRPETKEFNSMHEASG